MIVPILTFFAFVATVKSCSDARDKGWKCGDSNPGMRYFFDKKSLQCIPFYYLGCGNNENNFESKQSCIEKCTQSAPSTMVNGSINIASTCSIPTTAVLTNPPQQCTSDSDCATTSKGWSCKTGYCCPDKKQICSLKPDNGSEGVAFIHRGRYAWIDELNNCIRFSYFGRDGNFNNFATYKQCLSFCK